jgi:hypothetical protein
LKIALPFALAQAALGPILVHVPPSAPPPYRPRSGMAALAFRHALSRASRQALALVRPAHKFHGVFDMPPVFGQFHLALCFKVDGFLGSFRNGLGPMCFQQLTRIGMDFDFSHGVMLLSFCARP